MSKLSSLEIKRLENIRQNELFLSQLQLENVKPKREVKKRPQSEVVYEKSRHSKRAARMEPEKYKELLEGYSSYSSKLNGDDEELLEVANLNKDGSITTQAVTEYVPRQITTLFTENCAANVEVFLSEEQLGQVVQGATLRFVRNTLTASSINLSSETKIVQNVDSFFNDILQWKNAFYILTETKKDSTNFFVKRDRLFLKWRQHRKMGKNHPMLSSLLHTLEQPKEVTFLLFNFNVSTGPHFVSCGRLKLLEYHNINQQCKWSKHPSDNYFIFELLDTDVLVQSGVVLFGTQKFLPDTLRSLDTVLQPVEGAAKWTSENNPSIGTKIAKYFVCHKSEPKAVPLCRLSLGPEGEEIYTPVPDQFQKLYTGVVTQYAPPSESGKGDQLYHILFSDGDEEDWGVSTYKTGLVLYKEHRSKLR